MNLEEAVKCWVGRDFSSAQGRVFLMNNGIPETSQGSTAYLEWKHKRDNSTPVKRMISEIS
jgi:hypothetical protein